MKVASKRNTFFLKLVFECRHFLNQHPTSRQSILHPISDIPTIPHFEHLTAQASHILNIPHSQHTVHTKLLSTNFQIHASESLNIHSTTFKFKSDGQ